jgi:hypothetical protein
LYNITRVVLGRIHSLAAMANDRGDGVCEFLIVPAGRPDPPSCDRDLCQSLTLVLIFDAFLVGFVLIFAAAAFPFVFVATFSMSPRPPRPRFTIGQAAAGVATKIENATTAAIVTRIAVGFSPYVAST